MNIFGITFTQGARAAAAVRSTGAVETAKATQATQGMGVGQVHDQVDLSVDGVRAAQTASDIRFDRVSGGEANKTGSQAGDGLAAVVCRRSGAWEGWYTAPIFS